jgi:hypothetical protein
MLARSANGAIILQEKKMRIETNIKIIEQLSRQQKRCKLDIPLFSEWD